MQSTGLRLQAAIASVVSALAIVFGTVLLLLPLDDCGSVVARKSSFGLNVYYWAFILKSQNCREGLDARTFWVVFLYLLFAVALVFAINRFGSASKLMTGDTGARRVPSGELQRKSEITDVKKCPFCAETIRAAAIYCKHCRRDLDSK